MQQHRQSGQQVNMLPTNIAHMRQHQVFFKAQGATTSEVVQESQNESMWVVHE